MKNDKQKVAWPRVAVLAVLVVMAVCLLVRYHHEENPNSNEGNDVIVQIMDATSVYGEPLLYDFDFTYDTLRRGVVVSKEELKEHITFEKEEGNDVGTYAINGTVDSEFNLRVEIIPGEYTITKATYDMSNVFFDDQVVMYDGEPHSIFVSGLVPEGVTVEYENNNQTEAGMHTVIARFKGDEKNYNPITTELKADLFILEENVPDGDKKPGNGNGNGANGNKDEEKPNTNPDTSTTTPTDPNENQEETLQKPEYDLIIQIKSLYSVYGEQLKTLDFDFIIMNQELELTKADIQKFIQLTKEPGTNVGSYLISGTCSRTDIKVKFVTAHYSITKATYDMSKVRFENQTVTYDGKSHSLFITGELPVGVTVTYEGNERTAVGRHKVTAHFTGDSNNYELISDKVAYLTIEKKDSDSGSGGSGGSGGSSGTDPEEPGTTPEKPDPDNPDIEDPGTEGGDPEKPDQPTTPTTPGQNNPIEGEETEGEKPQKPGQPTTPTTPGQNNPVEGEGTEEEKPQKPGQPTTPGQNNPTEGENTEGDGSEEETPQKPGQPTPPGQNNPTEGENTEGEGTEGETPQKPGQSTGGEDSEEPQKPAQPNQPTTPEQTTPTESEETEEETPQKPEQPAKPAQPSALATPTQPSQSNPMIEQPGSGETSDEAPEKPKESAEASMMKNQTTDDADEGEGV